ncbi:L,D-transpeptidase [Catenulispora rubra]|uniref:L,D-transpeptidase n=1 Tax=Catenulispora rubra TaxID=280293 RepID=UPI00189261B3|nr:L,D-transpeptidase [Catenulispora rubra]
MRTSGAGKGGALIAVAGAVALGVTGCASNSANSGEGKGSTHDAVQQAAAVAATSSPAAVNGAADTLTSSVPNRPAGGAASSPAALPALPAVAGAAARNSNPVPKLTTKPQPILHPTKPTAPTTPAPPKNTGSNWLSGVPLGHNTPGALDPRCKTGRVICIDMSTHTLLWVVNGKVQYGMDVRFGDENNPTRKGKFDIYLKMEHCISTIYHTSMPDAMFFSGGEAVHFSIDFATYGYAHHSHGCVNVRDRAAVAKLFADTRLGDSVVVY